jgi:hypothetical protein
MAVKLIPNNITVSEQFALRYHYDQMATSWFLETFTGPDGFGWNNERLAVLEEASGIRCYCIRDMQMAGYELVDEKKFAWFTLKYAGVRA